MYMVPSDDLRSLDKDEFFDVYRHFKPGSSREEYDADWAEFQTYKAEFLAKKAVQ